jgi:PAS domain S-box-containing protein
MVRRRLFRNLFRSRQLRIRTRLTASFVAIILSMLVASVVAGWQFRRMTASERRLGQADQISHAAMVVQLDVDTLRNRLTAIADTHDGSEFQREAGSLRRKFLDDVTHAHQLFTSSDIKQDPLILSTLQTVRVTLPSQIDSVMKRAAVNDWPAVRMRLADQVQGLLDLSSLLVERVDREVSQQRAEAIENAQRARRQLLLVLPVTALFTMIVAVLLGWHVTRTITAPLSQVYAAAQALARGEFQHEVKVTGEDELATLGKGLNYATRRLRELYDGLRDSEEQWRAAFENNPTMYFMVDRAGTIVSVNLFGAEQLGYKVSELIGQSVSSISYEADKEATQKHAQECFGQLGRTLRWEARKTRKDGTMLWARETANAVFLKKLPVLLVVCEDITEQKRAEEALRRSEKELRALIENLPAMVFTALPGPSNEFVSRGWREYTGLSEGDTAGSGWQSVVHPEDLERHLQEWQVCTATGEPYESEARFRRAADGEYRWFLVRAVPLRDEQGAIVKWYGTLVDIEDRKRAEEERERLRQLEAELAHMHRVSMMGELSASLAHEIKQPMAAARTNADACLRTLKRVPPDLEDARDAASAMVVCVTRAAEIIDRVRALFSKSAPLRDLVDVNEIVREIATLLQNETARHSVRIHLDLAENVPRVVGDRVQLQQVLLNLMLNGIEAMPDAGELRIKSQQVKQGQVLISVSDTGTGIPPDKIDQIFNAFVSTKPEGTGMGLAISRSIIESHGGRLWATSNSGCGATFHFILPNDVQANT